MYKNIVILGSTGLIGSILLQKCIEDPQISEIRLLSRRPLAVTHPKVKVFQTNLLAPEQRIFDGSTALYCCIGTTRKKTPNQDDYRTIDHGITIAAAKAAKSKGVSEVHLISAIGADVKSNIFYSRLKGEIEQDLIGLNFDRTLIYQPALLIGRRLEKRFGEKVGQLLSPLFDLLLFGSLKKYHSISAKKVAEAMLKNSFEDAKGVQLLQYTDFI